MQTLSSDENSVCPSAKRMHCDKTEESSVQIFIPYERSLSLVFWEGKWLVGATPSAWNFGSTGPRWSEIVLAQLITMWVGIAEKGFKVQSSKVKITASRGVESGVPRSPGFGPESESLIWRKLRLQTLSFSSGLLCNFVAVYLSSVQSKTLCVHYCAPLLENLKKSQVILKCTVIMNTSIRIKQSKKTLHTSAYVISKRLEHQFNS